MVLLLKSNDISYFFAIVRLEISNFDEYKLIMRVGDELKKGDVYAKLQSISRYNDDKTGLFEAPIEKVVTEDCRIVDVKIYANNINNDIQQYNHHMTKLIDQQVKSQDDATDELAKYLTTDEINLFQDETDIYRTDKTGNSQYRIKGESINGIEIHMTCLYYRPITVGDKIGNRHGNKGIISTIISEKEMPMLDGEYTDVIINPLEIKCRIVRNKCWFTFRYFNCPFSKVFHYLLRIWKS
jgi:DNA-directed RNA polymerase beta subunit